MNGLILLCLFGSALFFVWIGFLLAREKETDYEPIRKAAEEREVKDAAERLAKNYVHVEAPMDESYTVHEPDIWDIEIEKYFSQVEGGE